MFKTTDQQGFQQAADARHKRFLPYLREDVETYFPAKGDNAIRLLPPLATDPNADIFGLTYYQYYWGERQTVAPNTFEPSLPNPMLDRFQEVKNAGHPEFKEWRGSKRVLIWVLDLMDKENPHKPKIWSIPNMNIDDIIKVSRNRATNELIRLNDPVEGRAIYFTRDGDGIQTRLSGWQIGDPFPINEVHAQQMCIFRDIVKVPTVEEARALVLATDHAVASQVAGGDVASAPGGVYGDPYQSAGGATPVAPDAHLYQNPASPTPVPTPVAPDVHLTQPAAVTYNAPVATSGLAQTVTPASPTPAAPPPTPPVTNVPPAQTAGTLQFDPNDNSPEAIRQRILSQQQQSQG